MIEKDDIIAFYDGCLRFIGVRSKDIIDEIIMYHSCLFNGNMYAKNRIVNDAYYREDFATDEEKDLLINILQQK